MDRLDPRSAREQQRQLARQRGLSKKPSPKNPGLKFASNIKALSSQSTTKKTIKALVSRKPSVPDPRPTKTVRVFSPNSNLPLLLDSPVVVPDVSSEYPTPAWFRNTESVDVSVIVPLYKSRKEVIDLINSWEWDDTISSEIIFVDDCCPFNSKQSVVSSWTDESHKVGKIIANRENQGYGGACNIGAQFASGKYLVFLNADTTVTKGWLKPIFQALQNEEIGIVGNLQLKDGGDHHGTIDGAGSEWRWDAMCFVHIGRHTYHGKDLPSPYTIENAPRDIMIPGERDMVTGCCIGMRKDLFSDIGGFNPNYKIGYWEDSEICMVVKERGLKIWFVPDSIIYHKLGHTKSGNHKFQNFNKNFFFNKWVHSNRINKLLKDKSPSDYNVGGILLQRMAAHGDVLVAAAVAPALKKLYPDAKITFYTDCPDIVRNNPSIDHVVTRVEKISERTVQLYYNLDMAYEYRPKTEILRAYAELVGVETKDCKLHLHTTDPNLSLPENYVVVHAGLTSWVGRDWQPEQFVNLATRIKALGVPVVCVGRETEHSVPCDVDVRGKTTISQLAHIIKHAKAFIGIDSLPMHIAQTFDVPGGCFFGCVDPKLRIISPRMRAITATGLACLGCHHRKPPPCTVTNVCETGGLECIKNVSLDDFWQAIVTLL